LPKTGLGLTFVEESLYSMAAYNYQHRLSTELMTSGDSNTDRPYFWSNTTNKWTTQTYTHTHTSACTTCCHCQCN